MSKQKAAKSVTNGQMADRVGFEPTGVARPGRWLTTAYDDMVISREKGARREVRRMLASRSRTLLERYPCLILSCFISQASAHAMQFDATAEVRLQAMRSEVSDEASGAS